jgi:hypothetical protein
MKALITGASSGLGRDFARELSKRGYDLILVARRKGRLDELKKELKTNVQVICIDLSNESKCYDLYKQIADEDIEIVINNAGYGLHGEFSRTDLDTELNMIDLNIKAVHILTKAFLYKFKKQNKGYILNVASSAAFGSGPLMSTYYATKGYVLKLSEAIYEELRREKSNVHISVLCPGPVDTEFNEVAGVKFALKGLSSEYVAKYALDKMLKQKMVIIPGKKIRMGIFALRLIPRKLMLKIFYNIQKKKNK